MRPLRCATVIPLLDAYHDCELSIEKQIAVDAHLRSCAECVGWLEELRLLRTVLRTSSRRALSNDDATVFTTTVVCQWKAEHETSLASRLRLLGSMFDDLHLVYAGLGAAVATAA